MKWRDMTDAQRFVIEDCIEFSCDNELIISNVNGMASQVKAVNTDIETVKGNVDTMYGSILYLNGAAKYISNENENNIVEEEQAYERKIAYDLSNQVKQKLNLTDEQSEYKFPPPPPPLALAHIYDDHYDESIWDWFKSIFKKQYKGNNMTQANDKQVGGSHYKGDKIQMWDFIEANNYSFSQGCVMKYVGRYNLKGGGGVEDLRKAAHYIEKMIERELAK